MQDFLNLLAAPVVMAGVFFVVVLVAIITIKNLIVIVPPNRAAVITGRNRMLTDGQAVGYRSISGGRTIRIPIIETVQHMNLETIPIEVSVNNAFSKGNIPLSVEAIANVKIASEPEWVFNNSVERLLGEDGGGSSGTRPGHAHGEPAGRARHAHAGSRERGPAGLRQGAGGGCG